jgi:putative membrane protein
MATQDNTSTGTSTTSADTTTPATDTTATATNTTTPATDTTATATNTTTAATDTTATSMGTTSTGPNTPSTGLTSPLFVLPQPGDASSLTDADRQFVAQASSGNLAEIAEGKIAVSNSDNAGVQVFGQWMAANHIVVGTSLNDIAKQLGVSINNTLTPQQAQEIQNLRSQSGAAFDQLYAQGQVADHQQTLALFQQEATNGGNAALKSLAQQAIPILQQHLAGAQQLVSGIGNSSAGSGTNSGGSNQTQATTAQTTTGTTPGSTGATAQGSTGTTTQGSTGTTTQGSTDTTPASATGTLSAQDTSFVQFAAQAGLAEVQEGQLAQSNSNLAVSEFGRWMVTDHTANGAVLQNLAKQEGITLPTSPSADQQSDIANLQSLPPDAFAAAYSKAQVSDHANTLMQFIKEAEGGQDPALKTFAKDTIPVLTQHLSAAVGLELNQLGASALGSIPIGDLVQTLYQTTDKTLNQIGINTSPTTGPGTGTDTTPPSGTNTTPSSGTNATLPSGPNTTSSSGPNTTLPSGTNTTSPTNITPPLGGAAAQLYAPMTEIAMLGFQPS